MKDPWDEIRLGRELRNAITAVTKSAGCDFRGAEVDLVTPPQRAEALSKAIRYDQLAAQSSDPVTAAAYRDLASQARGVLTGGSGHLAKAAEYEQMADRVISPADRQGYLDLARREREMA